MNGATARWLPDRKRLHLQHGPIDLIIAAYGPEAALRSAYENAIRRFQNLLDELVTELPELRSSEWQHFHSPVALKMAEAVYPFRNRFFITPMAAVAGAVADAVCEILAAPSNISKAYVNNGGDIAFHLTEGQNLSAALAGEEITNNKIQIDHGYPVRGIATSGWRGRSQSFGIADAVTVLASTAAKADAAATLIANSVNIDNCSAIIRRPASEIHPDSDLGAREVTIGVGSLNETEIQNALGSGLRTANDMLNRGLIHGAALFLQGRYVTTGQVPTPAGMGNGSQVDHAGA